MSFKGGQSCVTKQTSSVPLMISLTVERTEPLGVQYKAKAVNIMDGVRCDSNGKGKGISYLDCAFLRLFTE